MPRSPRNADKRFLNRLVARSMPLALVGLVGYASWVFISPLCVNYILRFRKKKATFIVLIVIYSILLLLVVAAYARTVLTINLRPGYIPRGPARPTSSSPSEGQRRGKGDLEAGMGVPAVGFVSRARDSATLQDVLRDGPSVAEPHDDSSQSPIVDSRRQSYSQSYGGITEGRPYDASQPARPLPMTAPGNLGEWLNKDAFVCESDGLPRWCTHCNCWKPDRSHHSSEVGRCVWRMDHFCPWVGGIVAENSYKYFLQAVFYATLYCLFLIVVFAVYIHEKKALRLGVNVEWAVTLGFACFFGFFSAGMTGSTSQLVYRNISTVDQLTWRTKVYQIAIHDPSPPSPSTPTAAPRVWLSPEGALGEKKCFAIVKTQQGENPWHHDSALENFREVLGESVWAWWLPFGASPLARKDRPEGWYRWNKGIMRRLRKEAGLPPLESTHPIEKQQKLPER